MAAGVYACICTRVCTHTHTQEQRKWQQVQWLQNPRNAQRSATDAMFVVQLHVYCKRGGYHAGHDRTLVSAVPHPLLV